MNEKAKTERNSERKRSLHYIQQLINATTHKNNLSVELNEIFSRIVLFAICRMRECGMNGLRFVSLQERLYDSNSRDVWKIFILHVNNFFRKHMVTFLWYLLVSCLWALWAPIKCYCIGDIYGWNQTWLMWKWVENSNYLLSGNTIEVGKWSNERKKTRSQCARRKIRRVCVCVAAVHCSSFFIH